MRIARLLLVVNILTITAAAQFTLVTGTVTDANGVPYALGTIAPLLITSSTPTFTATGQLYFPPSQASGLDSTGHFLVRIADNSFLSPGGTTWNFTVCSSVGTVPLSFGTGPQCFKLAAPITISGASQDITTQLHAVAPALTLAFGTGGTVSGSGAAGIVPLWTSTSALGNSLITSCSGAQTCASGSTTGKVEIGSVLAPVTAQVGLSINAQPAPTACGGSNVVPLPVFGCSGSLLQLANNASSTADVSSGLFVKSLPSQVSAGTLGVGIATQVQASANETETRGIYSEAYENIGTTTVTTRRGLFTFAANGTNNTTATNEGIVAQTGARTGTNTADYTVHILSPNLNIGGSGGTLTAHVGLQIEDQAAAGVGTNSSPRSISQLGNAPNAFQGHLNQIATGNWAGTCTMAAGTSCTITLTTSYTATPGCVVTVQSSTVIAGGCTVSGATVTVTAASSNSSTWAAMLFGNPN
jgi:hypothetical protein